MNAHQIVEAVLFASDAPLTADEIARADTALDEDVVEDALTFLRAEYDDAQRSFQIVEVAEGYQILTRSEYAPYLERFDTVPRPSRLSGPALETLAIIAYRQPIGRLEIEYIRGVGASGVIRSLVDRRLIDVVGRAEGLGRPLLYGTTSFFLEHFGFKSLEDLPRPDELPVLLRERIPLGPEDSGAEGEDGDAATDESAAEAVADAADESALAVTGQIGSEEASGSEDGDVAQAGAPGVTESDGQVPELSDEGASSEVQDAAADDEGSDDDGTDEEWPEDEDE